MKIEIGKTVEFIEANVKFRGQVIDIAGGAASVAVLGYATMFVVPLERLLPIAPEHPAVLLGIGELRELSQKVCWAIEECGASDKLTEASVLASQLNSKLNDLLP